MNRLMFCSLALCFAALSSASANDRPNVMIMISDDVSWPHASAYGSKMVSTPAFDKVARDGVLFNNAFCPSPGCSPSRAAFLTGRHTWMIQHAGTHASYFGAEYETFQTQLAQAGYVVGNTGKAWGPGNWKKLRQSNPCGPEFKDKPLPGESNYVAGFRKFLQQRPEDKPFCFWFGSTDAHRPYKAGTGLQKGKTLEQAQVPGFLPDAPAIRSDLLDYAFEVERFDDDCMTMLKMIEAAGELDNTIVIVTSDNGMPFPRAKANCYEYGIHMPLAVCWKNQVPGGRTSDDLVSFVDLTAMIYEATDVAPPQHNPIVGNSILPLLKSKKSGIIEPQRSEVYCARERHSSSRFNTLGYPQRAIRTHQYLFIRNFKPERWPAGPAQKYDRAVYDADGNVVESTLGDPHQAYHDIDACPALDFLVENRNHAQFGRYLDLSVALRPGEEMFDIQRDPDCLNNLADDPQFATVRDDLRQRLMAYLNKTKDARVIGGGDVWESYPRVSGLRWFPKPPWAQQHPESIPAQPWVDKQRPRQKIQED